MRLRLWFPLTLLLIVLAGFVPTAVPVAAAPLASPGGGWVKANVVGGGCDSQGHCSSEATPGTLIFRLPRWSKSPYEVEHGGTGTSVGRAVGGSGV